MTSPPPPEWLERANRLALTARLLSSTVHDVNNALQVISGSVELLQMSAPASETAQKRLSAIDTQAKRATRLLQELTEFVRDARTTAEPVRLPQAAQFALTTRQYALTKHRITAEVTGEATALVNPKHLHQVLLNLIINAEDAGASTLTIALSQDGADVVMTVTDNSPGTKAPPDGNLGIGLEVSGWLASLNGGRLAREPLESGGSRAVLRLPSA